MKSLDHFDQYCDAIDRMQPRKNRQDIDKDKQTVLLLGFEVLIEATQKKAENRETYSFFVFENNEIVGELILSKLEPTPFLSCELGYRVYNNHWGKGLGSKIAKAGVDYAFKDLELHRVEALIEVDNKPSIKIAEKAGLRVEGISEKRIFSEGQWRDMQVRAITLEDLE
ncbi:MAG: GNAT family N-acetyltransferase [Bacteriovoracaceae bacterium]|nr:GNAT family N-acetyltransferase [Bacteriovoracaceae bacterium]